MREHGAAKRVAMRAGWALSSLKDWTDYRRRKAEFTNETQGQPVHRIIEPRGPRSRPASDGADGTGVRAGDFLGADMVKSWVRERPQAG